MLMLNVHLSFKTGMTSRHTYKLTYLLNEVKQLFVILYYSKVFKKNIEKNYPPINILTIEKCDEWLICFRADNIEK